MIYIPLKHGLRLILTTLYPKLPWRLFSCRLQNTQIVYSIICSLCATRDVSTNGILVNGYASWAKTIILSLFEKSNFCLRENIQRWYFFNSSTCKNVKCVRMHTLINCSIFYVLNWQVIVMSLIKNKHHFQRLKVYYLNVVQHVLGSK